MIEKGLERTVITHIRGILKTVAEETLTLAVEPFEMEVLIPEHTRNGQVQGSWRADHAAYHFLHRRQRHDRKDGSPAGRFPLAD